MLTLDISLELILRLMRHATRLMPQRRPCRRYFAPASRQLCRFSCHDAYYAAAARAHDGFRHAIDAAICRHDTAPLVPGH